MKKGQNAPSTHHNPSPTLYRAPSQLLSGLFSASPRTSEQIAQWQRAHSPDNFAPSDLVRHIWGALVASPWLSPLLVPLGVLAFAARRQRPLALLTGGYLALAFLAWWLLTHRIDRFLVPLLPLAALLAGLGAVWQHSLAWRRTLAVLLVVALAFDFLLIAGGVVAPNRYLADLNVLRVDPTRVDPWHLYFNRHAERVQRLLLVGDAQPFDLEVPVLYNTVFDASLFERLARDQSPDEVRQALHDLDVSHIYVAWSEIARYRSPGNYGITDFLQPRVFDELVAAGVLEPLPPLADNTGQAFRVR